MNNALKKKLFHTIKVSMEKLFLICILRHIVGDSHRCRGDNCMMCE